jgi:hypothetical protein
MIPSLSVGRISRRHIHLRRMLVQHSHLTRLGVLCVSLLQVASLYKYLLYLYISASLGRLLRVALHKH